MCIIGTARLNTWAENTYICVFAVAVQLWHQIKYQIIGTTHNLCLTENQKRKVSRVELVPWSAAILYGAILTPWLLDMKLSVYWIHGITTELHLQFHASMEAKNQTGSTETDSTQGQKPQSHKVAPQPIFVCKDWAFGGCVTILSFSSTPPLFSSSLLRFPPQWPHFVNQLHPLFCSTFHPIWPTRTHLLCISWNQSSYTV